MQLQLHRMDTEVYHDILKRAKLAEELGFDSVWIAEHAFSKHGIISSPHSLLAAIAAQTTRVQVGVACSIVPWYHPLRLAQAGGLRGYEHYARDPFIDPELAQRRGQGALGAIGTPAQVTATLKDLQARHVTHFLAYMDIGGLPYPQAGAAL